MVIHDRRPRIIRMVERCWLGSQRGRVRGGKELTQYVFSIVNLLVLHPHIFPTAVVMPFSFHSPSGRGDSAPRTQPRPPLSLLHQHSSVLPPVPSLDRLRGGDGSSALSTSRADCRYAHASERMPPAYLSNSPQKFPRFQHRARSTRMRHFTSKPTTKIHGKSGDREITYLRGWCCH